MTPFLYHSPGPPGWLRLFILCACTHLPAAQDLTPARPSLALAVNRADQATLYRGWPWFFEAEILHAGSLNPLPTPYENLQLTPAPLTWRSVLRLEIRRADALESWPVEMLMDDAVAIELSTQTGARFRWWLDPTSSLDVPAGEWHVRGVLDTQNAPSGWRGRTNSSSAVVQVLDEPVALTPELIAAKLLYWADWARSVGDVSSAAASVQSLLSLQPTNTAALTLHGDLLAAAGDAAGALLQYEAALNTIYGGGADVSEPPVELHRKQQALWMEVHRLPGSLQLSAGLTAGQGFRIQWPGAAGRTYRVESSFDLRSWTSRPDPVAAGDANWSWNGALSSGAEFFRVLVQ